MNTSWKNILLVLLAVGLSACLSVLVNRSLEPSAQAQERLPAAGFPRYSVLDTEGHNLIVTDNSTNTLYFYTIDKDAQIGADLKLRGTLDLTQVGKPVIKPTSAK